MNFIEKIVEQEYKSILSDLTENVELDLQSVGFAKGKASGVELLKRQYNYLKDENQGN